MSGIDYQAVGTVAGGLIAGAGIAKVLIVREVARFDQAIGKIEGFETKLQTFELAMARDIPTKDDHAQVLARLDKLDAVLTEMRDMVIRQDERGKIHDKG